jgi:hypothetical protein
MPIHNKNSLLLSLGGGVLMILAGVSGAIGVIGELSEALQYFFGLEFFTNFENFMEGASTGTFVMGMIEQLQQSVGWVGAIMAYIGRIIAEQKPILDPE